MAIQSPLIIDDRERGLFRVHRSAFTSEEILALEREKIFSKAWLYVGHESELPKPNDFVTRGVGGRPVIFIRDRDGRIRVLLNTCRHRGAEVCRLSSGNSKVFACFYHGWAYDNTGRLVSVPDGDAYSASFDRGQLGLYQPRVESYRDFVFVTFSRRYTFGARVWRLRYKKRLDVNGTKSRGPLQARYARCDVLVNCAGTTRFVPHGDLDGLDDALIDEILATNVRGSFAAVRALLPLLRASPRPEGAVVINISSIAARTAMGSNVMYCASKAALDNMTQSLARALAPTVRVVSVSPGLVDTEFVKSLDPEWRDNQAARTPMGRLAMPEEVAAAVIVAVRDLQFSTGCVLSVDGGRPLN